MSSKETNLTSSTPLVCCTSRGLGDPTNTQVPAGCLVVLTYGEYNDYDYYVVGRTLQDVDFRELKEKYQKEAGLYPDISGFVEWLEEQGLFSPLAHFDVYLGPLFIREGKQHRTRVLVDA
ncbi:hypothetical protein DRN74_06035 [Candidatus Micrarchaeota archaeon]|nr:MAG: hypothetical protein DRN74_06035 [Candidatus Micrarchaeota archaeon]